MSAAPATPVASVYGAVTPPGRLALALATAEAGLRAGGASVERIDLHETRLPLAGEPGAAEDEAARAAIATVERARALLVASPVYRASFPGVLKNLFDLLPLETLRGKPVGVVVVGATSHHFLGVDRHARDVLSWFGALALPVSVYLTSGDFESGELGSGARVELGQLSAALLALARTVDPEAGPLPLAARKA